MVVVEAAMAVEAKVDSVKVDWGSVVAVTICTSLSTKQPGLHSVQVAN